MTYQEAATKIIKNAIKSAIFIDENAQEPYSNDTSSETQRTIELYNHFKQENISLSVFKYSHEKYLSSKNYLFDNRDIVLLDWKLQGEENGGEKSLEILSEIVNNQTQIQFCVIYTDEVGDSVLKNILSYFSGTCMAEYEKYKNDLSEKEEEINTEVFLSALNNLNVYRYDREITKTIMSGLYKSHNELIKFIHNSIKEERPLCSLIKCGIAYNNAIKSEDKQPCPSSIDVSSNTFCINNTIISIFNKKDVAPSNLFERFGNAVVGYNWGIMHLIGLELQCIQKRKGSYINADVLKVTRKALGYHKSVKENEFDSFLKDVMLEQEALNLRDEKLTLIDAIDKESYDDKLKDEYTSMNVFYNSASIYKDKALSFGDVFRCNNDYYICITALCDCIRPFKRDNRFYFAKGSAKSISEGMKIGDSGFISFIFDNEYKCVKWNEHETPDEPTYIIPESYLVPDNIIKDKQLTVQKAIRQDDKWLLQQFSFEYITTIKQNYAQRIANHAFTHPVRVGVDFIGKRND